jgi:hypothetical protein
MLRFDQARVCEAIICHLEAREGHRRADLCLRDQGTDIAGADARVEMTFRLGDQLYALEHTGIEPFDGFIEMNNEADRLFEPLRQSLTGALDPAAAFELTIRLHVLRGRRMNDIRKRHDALRQWVLDTAPTLPKRPYGDLRCGHANGTVIDMPVTLRRWECMGFPGYFMIRHLVPKIEESRAARMTRACAKKLPGGAMRRRARFSCSRRMTFRPPTFRSFATRISKRSGAGRIFLTKLGWSRLNMTRGTRTRFLWADATTTITRRNSGALSAGGWTRTR